MKGQFATIYQSGSHTRLNEGDTMKKSLSGKHALSTVLTLALFALVITSAHAIGFSKGELTGSFDTIQSLGRVAW